MTVRRRIRWFACLGLTLAVGAGSGCRLFNKGGSGGGGSLTSGTRDPLLGRDRIPATNLPTGRENARGKRDPLLAPPGDADARLSSDLPPSDGAGRKEPFRTGPETTAAGLARGSASDDPLLVVGAEEPPDRRVSGNTTGRGPVMLQGGRGSDAGFEQVVADLKRYGVRVGETLREGSDYVLRGERESADGLRRRYEGVGMTAAAAANDLLEQVRSDSDRK